MGRSTDYSNISEWEFKDTGYQTGAMVRYQGNIFVADFWAQAEPGKKPKPEEGWALYDELYDLTASRRPEPANIIAYIPTWRKREGFDYMNREMYRYITHGVIAFLMFSETNLGEFEPSSVNDVHAILTDVVNTGHQNGTRILIALGGATDYGFLNLMTAIGNNPDSPLLNQAVQNVVNFVSSNNLDGVDLDLECWWDKNGDASKDQGGRSSSQGAHPAGYALTLFAQKLKQTMPDKLVSAAVFGSSWYGNNYDPKLADSVDWLGVMTYDLTGSWNSSPVGTHSALYKIRQKATEPSTVTHSGPFQEDYQAEQQGAWPEPRENRSSSDPIRDNPILSVEDTLWYWTNQLFVNWQGAGQKLPRNKIAAGVPIYGYDFAYSKEPDDLSGQIPPGYKVIRYKDILAQFHDAHTAANANIKVSGSTPRPAFISDSGDYPYEHNLYFETPDTAVAKLTFLRDVGAQGVIIWELSNDVWEDGKSIIKALYQNSGNGTKPPLGTPTPESGDIRLTEQDHNPKSLEDSVRADKDQEKIKAVIMERFLKPAAFLAHLLGYGWCGGCQDNKPGYIGEGFFKTKNPEGWTARYTEGCEGYMPETRLKIYFSDWSFSIKKLNTGDVKNLEGKLMNRSNTPVDNSKGNTQITQTVGGSIEVQTQINTYNLKTIKWEFGGEISGEYTTPAEELLGGVKIGIKVAGKGGIDTQTGVVTTTSDKTTVTNTVQSIVPPGSRKDYRIDILGTQSRIDNCSIEIEVGFALEFDGFLRWGEGKTPKSNYHKDHRGIEKNPRTVLKYKFGGNGKSFVKDLGDQREYPGESKWDWELLRQDHEQDLEWAISQLTNEKLYTVNIDLGLEVIKGRTLDITALD